MSLAYRSYMDSILDINLFTGVNRSSQLDENVMRLLLGGKGLGTYLLYKNIAPKVDPLSPENPLIICVGPLTGTHTPTAGRLCIVTKSPQTHTQLDTYCGGFFGPTMKYSGHDAIVIKGAMDKLTTIFIDNDKISFHDATALKGKGTIETTEILQKQFGRDVKTLVIGPAAERLSPISGMFCDLRTLARGGGGAVMGSKNIKAVVVKGDKKVKVHNPEEFEEMVWISHRMLRMSTQINRLSSDGTANIVDIINAGGGLPTKNFKFGQFEHHNELWGETWRNKGFWKNSEACYGCNIACTKIANSKKYNVTIDGPEYETVFAMGSNCGVVDHDAIIYSNYLCDNYGIDTISVGNIIGFIMELYEKGIVTEKNLDGIKAEWGSGEALIKLTEKMCKGEGIGKLLEKGVKNIAEEYPGSEEFAMHVKGLEMPGYLPNAAKGIALSYAISERGACHLHGSPLSELMGGADPLTTENKAALFKTTQSDVAIIDSMVMCYFTKNGITLKEIMQMVNPATGFDYENTKEFEEVGTRISTLARLFNTREGFSSKDDVLPKRCTHEPVLSGPAKGHTVDLDPMKLEYYAIMGWDENGIPKESTLEKLGLSSIL